MSHVTDTCFVFIFRSHILVSDDPVDPGILINVIRYAIICLFIIHLYLSTKLQLIVLNTP